ncbi:MAG: D-sedoheptulose 7-phosphate isomerase [Candidatus Sumerlaeota bacterium]|nr:D-sedoheptulose 7-phosphate isomerase [Candidatus Sumerlaeota bacterium]
MSLSDAARDMIDEHAEALERFRAQAGLLQQIGQKVAETLGRGGRVLICGNGGSASQADHFGGELVGRFRGERCPLPAIALSASASTVTAIGNDFGFEEIFARQVEALGREGDLLLALSTSGRSLNVICALERARERGLLTVGLSGRDGGEMPPLCDLCLLVDSPSTARIQEMHLLALHAICEIVDRAFDLGAKDKGQRTKDPE